MNQKQQAFVAAYTDQSAKTFGNATQSAALAYPNMSSKSTGAYGHELLKKPQIQQSIQEILDEENGGYKVRLKAILRTALGNDKTKTKTTHPDGSVTVVERDIPHSQRLKAHELLLTLTGERDIARARANVASKEIERLGKQLLRDSSKVYEKVVSEPGDEVRARGTEGDDVTIPSPSEMLNENKNGGPNSPSDIRDINKNDPPNFNSDDRYLNDDKTKEEMYGDI